MRKQQYVAAVACLVAGAIGFVSVYATEKAQERKELAQQESIVEETQQMSEASNVLEPEEQEEVASQSESDTATEPQIEAQAQETAEAEETVVAQTSDEEEETVATVASDTLHFDTENGIVWPIEGEILLDYSMDATIYFPTLEQYRCNPALVIAGNVNDKVYSIAKGEITEIYNSEETGCTVKQDLGDGYTAIYGQLKELNFEVGDILESGQVIGYVSEPTKYYSVEGTNVYFEMQKDDTPIDPTEYLPMQSIDTFE